jgi:hypothetical protein
MVQVKNPLTAKAGKWSAEARQHVEFHRKYLLRKRLLRWAPEGAAYVPFVGDGDLAVDLYADRQIYAADLDVGRIEMASSRLPGAKVIQADCDDWTFPGLTDKIAVADFDAYTDPWTSFRSFWREAPKQDRLVLYVTDGLRQGMIRTGSLRKPDGTKQTYADADMQKIGLFHFYWNQTVLPWFRDFIAPDWRILEQYRYLRKMMVYGGFAIERV